MVKYLFLALSLTIIGCTKPAGELTLDTSLEFVTESQQDIEIQVRNNQLVTLANPKGEIESSELFHHLYIMQKLGEQTPDSQWAAKAQQELLNFYKTTETHSRTEFRNSPYTEFLIANSKAVFLEATKDIDSFFNKELDKVFQIIYEIQKTYPFPKDSISVSSALKSITAFMNIFENSINRSNLDPAFKSAIVSGIYEEFWLKLPATEQVLAQFESASKFEDAVGILRSFIDSYKIELSQDVQGKLASASTIGQMLNRTNANAREAFSLLVSLWLQMNDKERAEAFGINAPDLYDFLKNKSDKQLECMKSRNCDDLILNITKTFFILPEIKKYGADRIIADIEKSAVSALNQQTGKMATDLVAELPEILRLEISKKIHSEFERFKSYREHYEDFVRSEVQNWYEKKFNRKTLPSLERHRVTLAYNSLDLKITAPPSEQIEISADSMGNALLASQQFFKKPRLKKLEKNFSQAQIMALTRINQMLAHGGFSKADGQSFPSLSRAMSLDKLVPLNIQQLSTKSALLFTMPSRASIRNGFDLPENELPANFNIASQARLLSGFIQMSTIFKDWTNAPLDNLLGNVGASELLENIPAKELDVPAFPKDAFLAIAFGNASSILTNLKAKGSPLFIMCVDATIIWGDQVETCPKPSALAGLVSIEKQKRKDFVSSFEHALFLEALIQYLEIGDFLSKRTKSNYLLKAENGKDSTLANFRQAQPEVRNLAMAMTNFLISRLQSVDGKFHQHYDLNKKTASEKFVGLDQHLQILNALITSTEYFRIPPYKRAATRGYYALNQNFYNPEKQFYLEGKGESSKIRMAQALFTLPKVLPLLNNEKSANQLKALLPLWQRSLLREAP